MCKGRPLGEGSTYIDGKLKYATQDDAAFAAGVGTRLRTNIDDYEYICGIYCDKNGNYSIGTYFKGDHCSTSVKPVNKEDKRHKNLTLVAYVHSHPYCDGHVPNKFSCYDQFGRLDGDLKVAYFYFKPIYLAAPNGRLTVLTPYITRKNEYDYKTKLVCRGLPKDKTEINCG